MKIFMLHWIPRLHRGRAAPPGCFDQGYPGRGDRALTFGTLAEELVHRRGGESAIQPKIEDGKVDACDDSLPLLLGDRQTTPPQAHQQRLGLPSASRNHDSRSHSKIGRLKQFTSWRSLDRFAKHQY
jgi:hypothetical protein